VTKVAMVTGGGTGIGRAVALALARDGFAVVIGGRRGQPLERVAAEARSEQLEVVPVEVDVRNPSSVTAMFARVKELYGRLDLLFNNAGANVRAVPLEELTFEAWQTVIETNITGAFLCTQ
jgi:NAD(P)-dependent dehydrogenase (short-subunit alcohol dehydrogenase family)